MEQHEREYKLNRLRAFRNHLLDIADKKIFILEDSLQDTTSWRAYRQTLRDITNPYKDENGDANSSIESLILNEFSWPVEP